MQQYHPRPDLARMTDEELAAMAVDLQQPEDLRREAENLLGERDYGYAALIAARAEMQGKVIGPMDDEAGRRIRLQRRTRSGVQAGFVAVGIPVAVMLGGAFASGDHRELNERLFLIVLSLLGLILLFGIWRRIATAAGVVLALYLTWFGLSFIDDSDRTPNLFGIFFFFSAAYCFTRLLQHRLHHNKESGSQNVDIASGS